MKTKITEFSVTCYGPQWPDYFQGHGTGPKWDGALLGAGSNRKEAVEDLLGMVAEDELAIPGLVTAIRKATCGGARCKASDDGEYWQMYYIGLNWMEGEN